MTNIRSERMAGSGARAARRIDWRKQMSDTVAYGLLVYTALQIFVTMHAIDAGGASLLPMVALVVLVAGVIPLFRRFERRWEGLDDAAAADPALRPAFRHDQVRVWLISAGLPFVVTGAFELVAALL